MFWIPLMILGALFFATIAYEAVKYFLESNITDNSKYIQLIRQKIESGNVRVIAGVFDNHNNQTAQQAWEGESLDSELESVFNGNDRVTHVL